MRLRLRDNNRGHYTNTHVVLHANSTPDGCASRPSDSLIALIRPNRQAEAEQPRELCVLLCFAALECYRSQSGEPVEEQVLTMLRGQVGPIMLGTVFLFVGLIACAISAIRSRKENRILLWFGLLNVMWGIRILAYAPAAFSMLPRPLWASRLNAIAILSYLTVIPGLLFFIEMSRGILRRFLQILLLAELPICAAGVGAVLFTKSPYRFIHYSNVLVVLFVLLVALVISIPVMAKKSGIQRHRISTIGFLVVGVAALYANLRGFFGLPEYQVLEPLAFAVLIFSLGYVVAEKIFSDGRRLIAIENELAIAREIQTSILPTGIPEFTSLLINAAYCPMTSVAGDFYEFIPVDERRVGFLVADVSGHGVPAALIAAMIKVAMQSLAHCASMPGEVLGGLNRILSGQLRSQLVSAAYLWMDMERGSALYSAAGHPPLICWRNGRLERIESNGILIGVMPDADYPVCEIPLSLGDRFLLYTDGVIEPENASGDSFGDREFEDIVRRNQSRSPSDLSEDLLTGIRRWQPASVTQQDDITLIVIDIAQSPWNAYSKIMETTQASI
jgi:phosphoserine phosphatase RsbU/P